MPVYLDHAATTPLLPDVVAAMTDQFAQTGNPSSLHTAGRLARRVVEESRERIARAIGARPSEVVFTSGGTEADNLAILGRYRAAREQDARRTRIVASAIEHHAVLDAVRYLADHEGAEVTWVGCDADGVVDPEAVDTAVARDPGAVALVTLMWANNEVGTVQDVAAVADVAARYDVPLHTDAVQALGSLPVHMGDSGAALLVVNGHKIGGPVGVGALLARRDVSLLPTSHGGGQERQVRSGTLDVVAIRGLAVAVEAAVARRESEAARLTQLRDRLIRGAVDLGYGIRPGGRWHPGDGETRLPGNAHLLVPGCDGESLLYLLDAAGIECSTGSACRAGLPEPSHVLLAMGLDPVEASGALRLTLGHTSSAADVSAVLNALPTVVERARRAARPTRSRAAG